MSDRMYRAVHQVVYDNSWDGITREDTLKGFTYDAQGASDAFDELLKAGSVYVAWSEPVTLYRSTLHSNQSAEEPSRCGDCGSLHHVQCAGTVEGEAPFRGWHG